MACVTPASKKQKRECDFDNKWINEFKGIGKSSKGTNKTNNEIDILISMCTFLIRTNYIINQWVWYINYWVWSKFLRAKRAEMSRNPLQESWQLC